MSSQTLCEIVSDSNLVLAYLQDIYVTAKGHYGSKCFNPEVKTAQIDID